MRSLIGSLRGHSLARGLHRSGLVGLWCLVASTIAPAQEALVARPAMLLLDGTHPTSRLLLFAGPNPSDTLIARAQWQVSIEPAGCVDIDEQGLVHARAVGLGVIRITVAGRHVDVPLRVADLHEPPKISFRQEILPALTRHDCNSGGCHGAASGKDGFALSLFGYDPGQDHHRMTRAANGRRTDRDDPEQSLLLAKASGSIPHTGGARMAKDSKPYALFRRWIEEGAHDDGATAPKLQRIELWPRALSFTEPDSALPLLVLATWSDGRVRDVTDDALLAVDDPATAQLVGTSLRAVAEGTATILARYGGFADIASAVFVPADRPTPSPPSTPTRNFIDHEIRARLDALKLPVPERADDATFLRRVHLDLTHRLPSVAEADAFLRDESPDKRDRVIDRLVDSRAFAEVLTLQFAEILRIEARTLEDKGVQVYTEWLTDQFARGTPIDQLARELLTARGPAFTSAPANFWLVDRDPKVLSEHAAQVFMGLQIQCAQCHDHPFERWTMADYYGFAACFAKTAVKTGESPRERVLMDDPSGRIRHPVTNEFAAPRPLGAAEPLALEGGRDAREALADWMTSEANPSFAENFANRLFARFFGRGLVEPVDDVRISNPPSHPELHRALGARLRELNFDLRALAKELLRSEAYQAVAVDGRAGTFAGFAVRRLSAEPLLEAIDAVTGVSTRFADRPATERATTLPGPGQGLRFLEIFGRSARESACVCARRGEPTLSQALHLANGETIERKLSAPENRVRKALAAGWKDDQILHDLWMQAYARPPRTAEAEAILPAIPTEAKSRAEHWIDLQWAVLNSREFLFQH